MLISLFFVVQKPWVAWASVISCSHVSDLTEIVHQQCHQVSWTGKWRLKIKWGRGKVEENKQNIPNPQAHIFFKRIKINK